MLDPRIFQPFLSPWTWLLGPPSKCQRLAMRTSVGCRPLVPQFCLSCNDQVPGSGWKRWLRPSLWPAMQVDPEEPSFQSLDQWLERRGVSDGLAKLGGVRLELPQLSGLCARHSPVSQRYNHKRGDRQNPRGQSREEEHTAPANSVELVDAAQREALISLWIPGIHVHFPSPSPGLLALDIKHPKPDLVEACNPYT